MNLREEIDALQGHVHDAVLRLLHALVDRMEGDVPPVEMPPPAEGVPVPDPVMESVPVESAEMSVGTASGVGAPTVTITPPTEGQP